MSHKQQHLFDNPASVKWLLWSLYGLCAALLIADLIYSRHVTHDWESIWGFYGFYGFVSCVLLVLIAKWMRTFVMRPDDYYDPDESKEAESEPNVDG